MAYRVPTFYSSLSSILACSLISIRVRWESWRQPRPPERQPERWLARVSHTHTHSRIHKDLTIEKNWLPVMNETENRQKKMAKHKNATRFFFLVSFRLNKLTSVKMRWGDTSLVSHDHFTNGKDNGKSSMNYWAMYAVAHCLLHGH